MIVSEEGLRELIAEAGVDFILDASFPGNADMETSFEGTLIIARRTAS